MAATVPHLAKSVSTHCEPECEPAHLSAAEALLCLPLPFECSAICLNGSMQSPSFPVSQLRSFSASQPVFFLFVNCSPTQQAQLTLALTLPGTLSPLLFWVSLHR